MGAMLLIPATESSNWKGSQKSCRPRPSCLLQDLLKHFGQWLSILFLKAHGEGELTTSQGNLLHWLTGSYCQESPPNN